MMQHQNGTISAVNNKQIPIIRVMIRLSCISNGILGPVAENENIDLTCDTVGGKEF